MDRESIFRKLYFRIFQQKFEDVVLYEEFACDDYLENRRVDSWSDNRRSVSKCSPEKWPLINNRCFLINVQELPMDYSRTEPWEHLAALGLTNITETDCDRECTVGALPRLCLYTFVLEHYSTMSAACENCSKGIQEDCFRAQCIPADGFERGVMSVNRRIPGPAIEVCETDLLMVNVINQMEGAATTIHWHGILQQYSQWMDGVPYLTQCPIGNGNFRYVIPMEDSGTFFYHSHMGVQRTNGIFGSLVVRIPRSISRIAITYDLDLPQHVMLIFDWMHYPSEMFFPGLPTFPPGITPTTLLINGLGRFLNKSDDENSFQQSHPIAIFHVKRNQRYRFRIINANSMVCPILIQIEDHDMTVILTDGEPIEPVKVNSLVCYAGERYDVVINTHNKNYKQKKAYWIHYRGLGVCEYSYRLDQYAVLSYDSEVGDLGITPEGLRPIMAHPYPFNTILNHPNTTCGVTPNQLCVSDLRTAGTDPDIDTVASQPDVRLFIPFGFHQYTDVQSFFREGNYLRYMTLGGQRLRSATMSNISFIFPTTPSLYLRDTTDTGFCSPGDLPPECRNYEDSETPYCECPQFISIKQNSIVEMTFINDEPEINGVNHPIHLHGYGFYVMCMGQDLTKSHTCGEDRSNEIRLKYEENNSTSSLIPAFKDTVSVPSKGYTTVRWKADNPGDWLTHCHFEWHAMVGMMMAFRVLGEIAPRPPGFPICGNFDPLLTTKRGPTVVNKHFKYKIVRKNNNYAVEKIYTD